MNVFMSLRTTERAKTVMQERARAKGMSLGLYLDWMSQQSAIKNPLAPETKKIVSISPPVAPLGLVVVPATNTTAPATDVCPVTGTQHRKGGPSASYNGLYRCLDCQMRQVNGAWKPE